MLFLLLFFVVVFVDVFVVVCCFCFSLLIFVVVVCLVVMLLSFLGSCKIFVLVFSCNCCRSLCYTLNSDFAPCITLTQNTSRAKRSKGCNEEGVFVLVFFLVVFVNR